MTVSRKEILPETTFDVNDIETWIDTELNKSANQEILKKHGVLALIDYNTKSDRNRRLDSVGDNKIYSELSKRYIEKGWQFDYYSDYEYTLIKIR